MSERGLYVVLLSPHGLIRGHDLELGRDADTGGQTLYVVELARALAADPRVDRVDLLTRRIDDPRISSDYARREEPLGDGARIVRIDFGPRRYLRKESLWPYLDLFADGILGHLRQIRRLPDLIHSHYADGGWVGAALDSLLAAPLIHTGHSLGRVKLARLAESGLSVDEIEERFHITRRIEAEELALDHAALVVASTSQEATEQYGLYSNDRPDRTVVIPPGTDLSRFRPPAPDDPEPRIASAIDRFLRVPDKPLVLAIARPDPRKNLGALVEAFGTCAPLRELANLAIVAGSREDIRAMKGEPRRELTRLLLEIDRYDLYGSVAYPKYHGADDVPELYRLAANRHGVFVNPALTEPFGLTLIEAAASGLPIVATADGGPRDIIATCDNGELVDPLDVAALASALIRSLEDRELWQRRSRNGIAAAGRHYRWASHVERYLERAVALVERQIAQPRDDAHRHRPVAIPLRERLLITDIDGTLLGDDESLAELVAELERRGWGLGVATGRRLESAALALESAGLPPLDVWITAVGAEIYYGARQLVDRQWQRHLDYRWNREALVDRVLELTGGAATLQAESEQRPHKISFDVDLERPVATSRLRRQLREQDLHANLIFSHGTFLDVLPIRCSKGRAVRWVAARWGVPLESIVVAGDSGNDRDMLAGATPAIVVGNGAEELADLAESPHIHFATGHHARGILEGLAALDRGDDPE